MKTILLPTDYSETAKKAAVYALEFAKQTGVAKVILYNAYQAPVTVDPTLPVMQLLNMQEIEKISRDGMSDFQKEIATHNTGGVEIETLNEFAVLHSNIEEICERTGADLIIMGITGGGGLEEVLIGSNTINVVNHTNVPVLIIPSDAVYIPIEEIVLVCDYKKIESEIPQERLRSFLEVFKPKLFVLNVSHDSGSADVETSSLDSMLNNYQPEYHHADRKDFAEAVNEFVAQNKVDLIITIPKKHGFFESIFKKSHTKQLAYHTHVPLLCMHD